MRAGALDRRVTLLRPVTATNAFNEEETTFPDFAVVAASRSPVSDGERLRAAQVGATVTDRFQIRWSARVAILDPTWRLRCEGREYDITAVKEIGRRVGLEITSTARVAVK